MHAPLVVFVHGLWMNGMELFWLRRQMRRRGFRTAQFVYPTVRNSVPDNARALFEFARTQRADEMHFVGYSLGGVVTLQMLHRFESQLPPGRVVLLGSPVQGSRSAARLAEDARGRRMLGGAGEQGLLDAHELDCAREIGVIAGTRSIGLGRTLGRLPEPNDGTVAVAETALAAAKERLDLPHTHVTLLFSQRVAKATGNFLAHGNFRGDAVADSGSSG